MVDKVIDYCAKVIDILRVWLYLNRYAFSNVENELNIGIVVVVSPSWHRHVMICHFDVLFETQKHRKLICKITYMVNSSTSFLPCSLKHSLHPKYKPIPNKRA